MEKPMLKIIFFARLREVMEIDEISYELSEEKMTVETVLANLSKQYVNFSDYLEQGNRLMIAVNQEVSNDDTVLCSGDELAIFPPVTGG